MVVLILSAFLSFRSLKHAKCLSVIREEAAKAGATQPGPGGRSDPEQLAVVERAIMRLGIARSERAVPALVVLLGHWDMAIRSHAAEALGRIQDVRTVEPLIELLEKATPATYAPRKVASVALWRITGKDHGMDPEAWRTGMGFSETAQ